MLFYMRSLSCICELRKYENVITYVVHIFFLLILFQILYMIHDNMTLSRRHLITSYNLAIQQVPKEHNDIIYIIILVLAYIYLLICLIIYLYLYSWYYLNILVELHLVFHMLSYTTHMLCGATTHILGWFSKTSRKKPKHNIHLYICIKNSCAD